MANGGLAAKERARPKAPETKPEVLDHGTGEKEENNGKTAAGR